MNGWLGQVRLQPQGFSLGNLTSHASRKERAIPFLGTARLVESYELGRPVRRYNLGQLSCCTAPNGQGYCFDTGSGECVATWVSSSGAPAGSPACVQNDKGQFTHPSCLGLEPGPPTSRPELPPGCTYVAAEGNAMQDVICECYNCSTKQSDGWRGPLGDFISQGSKNPCLRDPQWFPKPAQCPSGPGGGGTYTPPAAATPPAATPQPSAAQAAASEPILNQEPVNIAPVEPPPMENNGAFSATGGGIPVDNVGPQPIPASGVPVLPPSQKMTYASPPTGAWPGQPFQVAPSGPVPIAKAPAPMPEACPLGPVPLRRWVEGCMGVALS